LGLLAADRCDVRCGPGRWQSLVRSWLDTLPPAGKLVTLPYKRGRVPYRIPSRIRGWGYRETPDGSLPEPSGSMTAAGVAALAIGLDRLDAEQDAKLILEASHGVHDGLAWLFDNFTLRDNPGNTRGASYRYDYLHALATACLLTRIDMLDEHDWYLEGAALLLEEQRSAGDWGGLIETCYALQFLQRATIPLERTPQQ
jgi:hypothetical protein